MIALITVCPFGFEISRNGEYVRRDGKCVCRNPAELIGQINPLYGDIEMSEYEVCKMWWAHFTDSKFNFTSKILDEPPKECRESKAADKNVPKWTQHWDQNGKKYLIPYTFDTNIKSSTRDFVAKAARIYAKYTKIQFMEKSDFERKLRKSSK